MIRGVGWVLIIGSIFAGIAELAGLKLPTLSSAFRVSKEFGFLRTGGDFPWFGWLITLLVLLVGCFLVFHYSKHFKLTPITQRRLQRFKSIRRGYVSLWILLIMALLGSLDHLIVGKEALYVRYAGKSYFPAFVAKPYKANEFGDKGDRSDAPPNYRELQRAFKKENKGNKVIMPLVPFSPTNDTIPALSEDLVEREGLVYRKGDRKPYSGLAATLYDINYPERQHMRYRYRKGLKDGAVDGWTEEGSPVYRGTYKKGELLEDQYMGKSSKEDFLKMEASELRLIHYNPAPPLPSEGHLLGTTAQGYDLLAYLYGGMQVNFKAALFYIPFVYFIGLSIGLLMGFFGGAFDIIVQRLIEIFSNIPFLFVIVIISSMVPEQYKGLGIILVILVLFGWMGMTYVMRAAALKEKSRDYVKAARVIGSSTSRILWKHLLPNTVAIIVTLIPFSISSVILSLTSLDYLGFGLPPKYATWGRLLSDGLANLSSPWLVTSAFVALVTMLILVTFVGEAVREAFDPKKYTTYR